MCVEFDTRVARKFISLRQSASNRSIKFDLSLLSVRNILKAKRCAYTGVLLNEVQNHPNKRTVDRVDNNKGYVIGNVVACCYAFNTVKGNLTLGDLAAILKVANKKEL